MHIGRAWKIGVAVAATLAVAAALGLAWWLPSEAELAQRVAQAASDRLGVKVTVGALHWQLLPRPQLQLEEMATEQEQPLQLKRLTLVPRVTSLLGGTVALQKVELAGGVIAQRSLRGLGRQGADTGKDDGARQAGSGPTGFEVRQFVFHDLTWISRTGIAVVYDGDADFSAGWRLQRAVVRRPGIEPATDITITRDADAAVAASEERFVLRARVGGGSADGHAVLVHAEDGSLRLTGELAPRGVEVLSGLAAFNRRSPVSGRASGRTQLTAEGTGALALAQTLHTSTAFTMQPATLVRFDVDRAVRTLGREHTGQTVLETLTGRVDTQNSPEGMQVRFIGLKAQSGALTASGDATLQNRELHATAAVDLIDGVVGVPMRVDGPLGALKVSVRGGAIAGAVAGTAVLPGIGTVVGAALGRIFGGGDDAPPPAAKPRPPAQRPDPVKPR